ncbi:ATPase [Candidatus Thiomargarita nelsonii]|uniref:ATPase n=1 Tax=Candidatus Thiomargarita nelsonii TaxID=1003181 RepID=A0A0A6P0Z4_9GAMM|nr:ATPase [Candidatus Thiomargarita nelsonii]
MYRQQLSYLSQWVKNKHRKPIVIRGARQVGKSTLVRLLSEQCHFDLIALNFERNPELSELFKSNDPKKITQLISLHTGKTIRPGHTLLFLDEIQAAATAIVALRYFYEELPALHILAAGSLLEFTLSQAAFSMPVGRIEYLHLGPMTFEEFLIAVDEKPLAEFIKNYQLNEELPKPIHDKLMALVKIYFITGGMPESIKAYLEDQTFLSSEKVKQSILSTYRDDFGKYASPTKHDLIRQVFNKIPTMIGNKFKYSHINRDIKPVNIATALNQLCLARVAWKVHHTAANGVPLGAEQNDRFFKVLFLDIGLISTHLGLNYLNLMEVEELDLVNNGGLAEQFVGQHLLYSEQAYEEPNLYYWVREKKSASAELDYVINLGQQIIPIEVKAGKTGQMKSLHLFLKEKQRSLGVRFNSAPPSQTEVSTKLSNGSPVDFRFISLPLYLVGQVRRLSA